MAKKAEGTDLFRASAMRKPEHRELASLSEEMGLRCSEEELKVFTEALGDMAKDLTRVTELYSPSLLVKYPRSSGQKPLPEKNPHNAWAWRCEVRGAQSGLLAGRTVGVKDNVCVAGVPMMNGSRVLEGFTPRTDATVVTRILDAGGVILGKTNCEDLCFSGSSWTCANGPVTNPHDVTRSAGGSSSGSAVAVSTGDVDMALGGDQGGSIRIPASWCGIVGLKPTHGLVPYTGIMPIEITLDHVGPMARTVKDCALLLEAIAGYDGGRDPRQLPNLVVPPYSAKVEDSVKGKKVGLVTEGFDKCVEDDVKDVVRQAALSLSKAGVQVSEVSIPLHTDGKAIWGGTAVQGAYSCMVNGNGGGYCWKGAYEVELMEAARRGYASHRADMSSIMKYVCLAGEYMERNYGNLMYARAQTLGLTLTAAYDSALQQYDALIMPTLPLKASKLPTASASVMEKMKNALEMVANTAPFDLTGHPALSVPAGTSQGLPVGMMLVGRHYDDVTLLQLGHAFEKIRDGQA